MSSLQGCASRLLIFLQNINRITFQRIDDGQSEPKVLFEITRDFNTMSVTLPKQVQLNSITRRHFNQNVECDDWLVANATANIADKHATASVACSLRKKSSSSYRVDKLNDGEVFCFLPLSQQTGLPVHINGNFAVINNRRGIWTSDEAADKADTEVIWNVNMMKLVIPKAYCHLLIALQQMHSKNVVSGYVFYELWPLQSQLKLTNPWVKLLSPLYELITKKELFFSTTQKWLTLHLCKVLETGLLSNTSESTPECVLNVLTHLKVSLVNLPVEYRKHINLDRVLLTEEDFVKLFFKKLTKFDEIIGDRNEVIQYLLEIYASEYDDETNRSYFLHDYLKNMHVFHLHLMELV